MDAEEARSRLAGARVARLATADSSGVPHVVAVCFAVDGSTIYSAVDQKPKRTTQLKRLANLRANPRAALLVDFYDDADWSRLWWARADGAAAELDPSGEERERALDLLAGRYKQYALARPAGAVAALRVERWSGWRA